MRRLADVVYRAMLWLFPVAFRRRHAAAMVEQFRRQRCALRGRRAATLWLWVRVCADTLRHALGVRIEKRRSLSRSARYPRRSRGFLRGDAFVRLDVRRAVRSLRRSPWYSITVLLVVVLCTALSATVFAMVDGVLFRPLPYPRSDLLYMASARDENGRGGYPFTAEEVDAWRLAVPGLQVAAFRIVEEAGTAGDGRMYGAASVDDRFFEVLGQAPFVGGFRPDHFHPGAPPSVLISVRLWQRVFGGRPDILGVELPLAGAVDRRGQPLARPVVAGILGVDFVFPDWNEMPDVIRPLVLSPAERANRNQSAVLGVVRCPEPMRLGELQQRLDAAVRSSQAQRGARGRAMAGVSLRPVSDIGLPYAKKFRTLAVVAAFLAAIAIAGIGGLTLARTRQREQDVRLMQALGATRLDLLRQNVFEMAPLVLGGTALGLALSPIVLAVSLSQLPLQLPLVKVPRVDLRVAGLAAALGSATTLLVSLAATGTARRTDVRSPVRTTLQIRRLGQVLVAAQAGLAFVLTLGGTLIVTSLWQAWQVDPGYETEGVAAVRVSVRAPQNRAAEAVSRMIADFERLPAVSAVGVLGSPLLTHSRAVGSVAADSDAKPLDMQMIHMGGSLPAVLGLAPVQGRLLTRGEIDREAPAVVLSVRAAEALWPGEIAAGRTLVLGRATVTVVGVVPDAKYSGLVDPARPIGQIYVAAGGSRQKAFLVRTRESARDVLPALVSRLSERRDEFDLLWAGTLDDALAASISERRFSAWAYGGLAASGLGITAVAILGMVAMITALRTREIGVRQALGATRWALVRLLLREQLAAAFAGLSGGAIVAAWSVGTLRRELYGIGPTDPTIWVATGSLLLATIALATLLPALHASRLDPAVTLRAE
jgi:predicted permease